MRIALVVFLAALIAASTPAQADPLDAAVQAAEVHPAFALRADFGGPRRADYRFGITLTDRDPATLSPPPMLTLFERGQQPQMHFTNWGLNVGLMLLAGGAAVALIVAAAGHAAEEQQQGSHGGGSNGGGNNGGGDGNCVGTTGSAGSPSVDLSGCPGAGG